MTRRRAAVLSARRRWSLAADARATAETWVAYLDSLDPAAYTAGPDTTGLSFDFESRKQVVTSQAQTGVTTSTGATTTGFQPGNTYWNKQIDFNYDAPTSETPIIFKNVRERGPASYTGAPIGLFKLYDTSHAPVEIYAGEVAPQTPHPNLNGLHGYRFTARYLAIHLVVDGVTTFTRDPSGDRGDPDRVDVQQCWTYGLAWFSQAAAAALGVSVGADGTHCDCRQQGGGSGTIYKYNRADAYTDDAYKNTYYDTSGRANAAFMCTPDDGPITATDTQFCRFSGGRATCNFAHDAGGIQLGNVGILKNCLFTNDAATVEIDGTTSPFVIDVGTAGPPDTRNKYIEDGTVVPVA